MSWNEQSQYQEAFGIRARAGAFHRDGCCGWFLSELDVWEHCGVCNPGGREKAHPEEEYPADWTPEAEPEPVPTPEPVEDDGLPF